MDQLLRIVLIVFLVLLIIGMLPTWPYTISWGWGYYPSGGLFVLLLLVVALLLVGDKRRLQ